MPPKSIVAIIVTYKSSDVIIECLQSLIASDHDSLKIVVCDNDSPDDTVNIVREWAVKQDVTFDERSSNDQGYPTFAPLSKINLIKSSHNLGFAGGVNRERPVNPT